MSIARFINGRLLSKVQMVSTNREEQVINAKKAYSILGPMKIKSKERIITRGPGGGDGGNNGDDGPYNDTPSWVLDNYIDLGGGYYWDGNDIWEDVDGDGIPDYICLPPVIVDGGSGQNPSEPPLVPPTDPFDGVGGGNGSGNSGGGGGGSSSDESENDEGIGGDNSSPEDEISDDDAYELGYHYFNKINDDILNVNYTECGVGLETLSYYSTPFNWCVNVQGLWASWLPLIDNTKLITSFGGALSGAGFFLGMPQLLNTIVVAVQGDLENLTANDVMNSVSTVLSGVGFFGVMFGVISTPATIAALGISAAVIGVTSIFVNDNYNQFPQIYKLDNGLVITILMA